MTPTDLGSFGRQAVRLSMYALPAYDVDQNAALIFQDYNPLPPPLLQLLHVQSEHLRCAQRFSGNIFITARETTEP